MKRISYCTVIAMALFQAAAFAQVPYRATPDSLMHSGDSVVSNFLTIPDQFKNWPDWTILGFVLKIVDSSGQTQWQSDLITPLDKDDSGYSIKADIPNKIAATFPAPWCSVVYTTQYQPHDTMMWQYGGIRAGDIKLKLISAPKGAEAFLVPNRTWLMKILQPNGKIDYDTVEKKYRVDGGPTEITALVDETVYVVVYKLNGKYKSVVHYTKPKTIEPEQTIFVNF